MIKLISNNNLELVEQINESLSGELTTLSTEQNVETPNDIGIKIQDPKNILDSLGYMWKGMLGIFIIIGVIIGVVTLLNKVKTKNKD